MTSKKKKIFLIDGMALIYRAHYAMVYNQLTTSAGMHTSAIFGFISCVIALTGISYATIHQKKYLTPPWCPILK